jgi:hypothetical protein
MGLEPEGEMLQAFLELMDSAHDRSLLRRHYDVLALIKKKGYAEALRAAQMLVTRVNYISLPGQENFDLKNIILEFLKCNVYHIRGHYLPEDQLRRGYFVDAQVQFVEGSGHIVPGFWADDGAGGRRRCKIRWSDAEEGEVERLLIAEAEGEEVILDPRPQRGDIIRIKYRRRTQPQFRFMMYDGIIEEGVFERRHFYAAKVVKFDRTYRVGRKSGRVFNLGTIYAEPINQLEKCKSKKEEMMNYRIVRGQ